MTWLRGFILVCFVGLGSWGWSFDGDADTFAPAHRLAGIGADRSSISALVLQGRTQRMIESQTFTIMRDPEALVGAERITNAKLQKIFDSAAEASGFPASVLSAISYLESFGNPKAESPAGPKGIMQFSESTARAAGLKIVRVTKYRSSTATVQVRNKKGKLVTKKVKTKTPYVVVVRDERFMPERAIPAAAHYLAHMTNRFGRQDWAVFAYHCGEGCVSELQPMTEKAVGYGMEASVAAMFFAASPAYHHELYEALQFHMQRDYSPTY